MKTEKRSDGEMALGRFGAFFDTILQKRRQRFAYPLFGGIIHLDIGCRVPFTRVDSIGIDKEGTTGNKLDFPDSSFDYVTMFAVVEHIKTYDMVYLQEEIARVLEKDGVVEITTPAKFAHPLLKVLAFLGIVPKKDIDEHCAYYNKYDILDVFTKFDLISYKRFDIFNQRFILCKK